jgi:hypothetical protein
MNWQHRLTFYSAIVLLTLGAVARADSRIEKNLKLEPGGKFVLEASGGDATVTGTPESGARVVITSNRDDLESLFDFRFEEAPGIARVVAHKRIMTAPPEDFKLRFEVQVPTRTSLEMKTGGGDVHASRLEGEFDLHTSGGDVKLSDLTGNVEARTAGGDITLRHVTGDAQVETSGGDVRIDSASGHVEAHTSGGEVEVAFARGNARGGEIETSGGSIEVALDPAVNLSLDVSASGGELTTDLPMKVTGRINHSSLQGTLGAGGETLRLHTSGGDIHLRGL